MNNPRKVGLLPTLLYKELLGNLHNQRYVITFLLLVGLIGISVWTLTRTHRTKQANYAQALQGYLEEARSAGQVWQFMSSGISREKGPEPLAILARGLDDDMTRALTYSGWKDIQIGAPKELNNLFRMHATPDYVYIINVVGSLLALLFVYDAVSGEKEQGTLRLQLTYPIPRDYLLLAKWLAGVISLSVPLALATLGAWAYLFFSNVFTLSLDHIMRMAMLFAVSLLFLSTFFTLGLLVSCLTHRTMTSLMVCLFLWITLVLTLPNLTPMIARGLRPIPSQGKVAIEKRHKENEIRTWAETYLRQDIPEEDDYERAVNEMVAREVESIELFRRNLVYEQTGLSRNLARLSPSACYLFAGYDLARTGVESFLEYQRYVRWYRSLFNQAKDELVREYSRKAKASGGWWGRQNFSRADINRLPAFRPLNQVLAESLSTVLFDIGLLVAYNVLFFLAAYIAFLRYDAK